MFKEIEYNKKRSKPRVIFSLSNTIRFPSSLIERFNLEDKKYVRIFVDNIEENFKIGFLFTNDKQQDSLKFSRSKSGGFISGNSLFSTLGFNPREMKQKNKERKFNSHKEKFEDNELIVIEVKNIKEESEDGKN